MSSGILGIGVSALNAAQAGVLTTGHNIANASTPGYNRQEIVQTTAVPQLSGGNYIGNGVNVTSVQRVYSDFLAQQVTQAQAQSSQSSTYYTQVQQIDNVLGNSSTGLSSALQNFFASVQNVADNPSSVPSRQAMLSSSQSLVSNMQLLDQTCSQVRDNVNSQITASVSQINALAQQIAQLNQQILSAESVSAGQPANDLRDQRDYLVSQLNQQVSASVVKQSDGSYNVFIGSGQALVVGSNALTLTTGTSPTDPGEISVAYRNGNGSTQWIPDASLQGGALGGYLAFRSGSLDPAQNALGQIAVGLALSFNAQSRLGQDLNGNLGQNYFSVPQPTVLANANNSAGSSATASIADTASAKDITTSDYQLTYDGTTYTLTRLSDGTSVTTTTAPSSGSPLTMDGVSVTSASMSAGDSFVIEPTRDAAQGLSVLIQNTSQIAAASPIQTSASSSNTGTASISAGSLTSAPTGTISPLNIVFTDATHYNIEDTASPPNVLVSNASYTSGDNIGYTPYGWTVQITGAPAAGDTFTVGPNTSTASSDNRNALALAALETQKTIGGTASYGDAYSQLVSEVGSTAAQIKTTNDAQTQMLTQAQQAQQSLSGVNIDEEAANLLRYQQAYQAAGKVVQIASQLFNTVLNMVG